MPPRRRRAPSEAQWSRPVALGGGWRIQYHKEPGEEFTHYRLISPPERPCADGGEPRAARIVAFDSLRVLPWLQQQFKGAEGAKLFRAVACGEPGALERARRAVLAVDRQASVEREESARDRVARGPTAGHDRPRPRG